MSNNDVTDASATAKGAGARTTREDWIALAKDILVSEGVEKLKVLNLAQKLGVSRSSFYWFFKSRNDLLDQLLHHWEHKNTASIVERADRPAHSITEAVLNVFECWVDAELFDPGLDFAIREWARRSADVRQRIDIADEHRVAALSAMFRRHGFADTDAFIRARVLYFMQVGYYAIDVKEPTLQRLSYLESYMRSFTGEDASAKEVKRFRAYALKTADDAKRR